MAFPNFKLEAAYATPDPFAANPVYTDISSRLKSAQWGHERQRELDAVSPALASFEVDNSDRGLEILYAAGSYYPNVRPNVRYRLSVSIGGGGYQTLFVGYSDDIISPWSNQNDDTATISCVDAFQIFQLLDLNALYPQQTIPVRIGAVLDTIGWPTSARNITSSTVTLPPYTPTPTTQVLPYFQLLTDSRPGTLYMDKSGNVVSSGYSTPAGSLPSVLGFNGVDIVASQPRAPLSSVYNVIKCSCSSPQLQNNPVSDGASIAKYRRRVLTKTVVGTSQATIDAIAAGYLARTKNPVETFDQLAIQGASDAAYSLMAAVDIGSTGTLARRSDVGADYVQPIIINAYDHRVSIGDGQWLCTLRAVARQLT